MDEEETAAYKEACKQCAAVDWGISSEGQFFCKSCHTVIEKTQEVEEHSLLNPTARVSSISQGQRRKQPVHGREWMVCEGFQFALKSQAEALVNLGVNPLFKTDVLIGLWRRYLQKTAQAYTRKPLCTGRFKMHMSSDSEYESEVQSLMSGQNSETSERSGYYSGRSSDAATSVCSGSLDAGSYVNVGARKRLQLMTMPRTLALCHLALLWAREAVTLADLLRWVAEGSVPYVNIHEKFPEEMRAFGKDAMVFRTRSIPSYKHVQTQAAALAKLLELPAFPPVTPECLLHPGLLSLRYLLEINLPDALHVWVCTVMNQAEMGEEDFLTFDPTTREPSLLSYEIQTAALIIVTLKLLFRMNDEMEWILSNEADSWNEKKKGSQGGQMFSVRKWYKLVQRAQLRAKQRKERAKARFQWNSKSLLICKMQNKTVVFKRRRESERLQRMFQRVAGSYPELHPSLSPAPSFRFCWGEEGGADGPSLHLQVLHVTRRRSSACQLANTRYWQPALRRCKPHLCPSHFTEVEPTLPRMYVWLLDLFAFLLGVEAQQVHDEVMQVERRFLKCGKKIWR